MHDFGRAGLVLAAVLTWAVSVSAAPFNWMPDQTVVAEIEDYARTRLPDPNSTRKAPPLEQYARYYAGVGTPERKAVLGIFMANPDQDYPAGAHIVPLGQLPMISGGGCNFLSVWYDVNSKRVEEIRCNAPM